MARSRLRVGFTLVELLVVIGIIALLISVLLPALSKAKKSAQEVVCASNLRQWGIGIQMYADQSKGQLPQKGPDGSTVGSNSFGFMKGDIPNGGTPYYDDPSLWFNAIPPLVNGKSYFQMIWEDYKNVNPLPKEGMKSIFICPSAEASVPTTADQVINGYFSLYGTETPAPQQPDQVIYGGLIPAGTFKFASSYVFNSKLTSSISQSTSTEVKMSTCRPTSQVVLMVEKLNQKGEYKIQDCQIYNAKYHGAYNSSNLVLDAGGYESNIGQSKADWRRFTTRHRNGGNILFADGHVQWFSWLDAQIQPYAMPGGAYNNSSDANQPSRLIWSVIGPVQ